MESNQPWDRSGMCTETQIGKEEPPRWYARFRLFMALPAFERSLVKAWREELRLTGRDGQKERMVRAPTRWYTMWREWRWEERAAKHDIYVAEQDRKRFEADRVEDRSNRIRTLKALRGKLIEGLQALEPSTAKWNDVITGFNVVVQQLRAEYGDIPIQPIDVTSGGKPLMPTTVVLVPPPGAETVDEGEE